MKGRPHLRRAQGLHAERGKDVRDDEIDDEERQVDREPEREGFGELGHQERRNDDREVVATDGRLVARGMRFPSEVEEIFFLFRRRVGRQKPPERLTHGRDGVVNPRGRALFAHSVRGSGVDTVGDARRDGRHREEGERAGERDDDGARRDLGRADRGSRDVEDRGNLHERRQCHEEKRYDPDERERDDERERAVQQIVGQGRRRARGSER